MLRGLRGTSFCPTAVNYAAVMPFKRRVFEAPWGNFAAGRRVTSGACSMSSASARLVRDYALFRALKVKWNGANSSRMAGRGLSRSPWPGGNWPKRLPGALCAVPALPTGRSCSRSTRTAKACALIGEFLVAGDVRSRCGPILEYSELDERHRARFVGGVPPDYFSALGQLWGNPVYDWDAIRATGYRWR